MSSIEYAHDLRICNKNYLYSWMEGFQYSPGQAAEMENYDSVICENRATFLNQVIILFSTACYHIAFYVSSASTFC